MLRRKSASAGRRRVNATNGRRAAEASVSHLLASERAARAAALHGRFATVATTGTNGKTTTTSMIAAIVAASGQRAASLTTVGAWVDGERVVAQSPSDEFFSTVERAAIVGVETLALEVTSKSLAEGFARQWPPSVAVFTNLTHDHLDLHGSMEAYLAAKAQLFMSLLPGGTAVLNADDPASELLRAVLAKDTRVVDYSIRGDATLQARTVTAGVGRTSVELAPSPLASALGGRIELAVSGAVHGQNALAAALAADAAGYSAAAIKEGLASFAGVRGRFEVIAREPLVVVDYAHTPDGLRGTLESARSLCDGALYCVFGCGGERDREKRPVMGAIADALSDVVVLTSDNPRREEPSSIAAMIREGASSPRARWVEELDRQRAIGWAIEHAAARDVIVIAGKGHEQTQEHAGRVTPFCDATTARDALALRDSR